MWSNAKPSSQDDDDDSWQVRAFEEDTTGNLLGCTWPPRSYTCTFCRREFRSAQALGGHMNVHRRDRARLHDAPAAAAQPVVIQNGQEFVANGLCLLFPLPNPNSIFFPNPPPMDFSTPVRTDKTAPNSAVSSICPSSQSPSDSNGNNKELAVEEELDLELRLGPRVLPPPS